MKVVYVAIYYGDCNFDTGVIESLDKIINLKNRIMFIF
jgi:hypothetical protein